MGDELHLKASILSVPSVERIVLGVFLDLPLHHARDFACTKRQVEKRTQFA